MALPKPRERQQEAMRHAIAESRAEAQCEIDERGAFYAAEKPLREYRNRLVAMLNEIEQHDGEARALDARAALQPRIDTCEKQLSYLNAAHRPRAFDEETLVSATRRRLLLRHVTPSQLGRFERPNLDIDQTASAKTMAQKERSQLVKWYEQSIAVLEDMFDDARAGAAIFATVGEVIADRDGRRFRSRFATPMDLSREIEKMRTELAKLRPRTYTQKRKVTRQRRRRVT